MASNYYNQDPDDNRSYQKTVAMCVAAASLVILLFLVILYVNSDRGSKNTAANTQKEEVREEDDILKDSHNITSSELEFWDDAKKAKKATPAPAEEEGELTPYKDPSANDEDSSSSSSSSKKDRNSDEEGEGSLNKDKADDKEGKDGYIAVTDDKGNKKYYEILSEVPKNDYDLENNLLNENGTLTYKDNKRESIKT